MAQDEAAAATTPLEVATHFPGSSGIRLPTDQTIGIDASKRFRSRDLRSQRSSRMFFEL